MTEDKYVYVSVTYSEGNGLIRSTNPILYTLDGVVDWWRSCSEYQSLLKEWADQAEVGDSLWIADAPVESRRCYDIIYAGTNPRMFSANQGHLIQIDRGSFS